MKYCPECDSDFPDSEKFCEFDGALLMSADADVPVDSDAGPKPGTSLKLIAVAVGGVVIGVMLFLIYYAMTREPKEQSSNTASSNPNVVMQQQALPLFAAVPSPVASPSPSVEPSPSPSPSATVAPSPSPQTERRTELSAGAISTASDEKAKSGPVLIRLVDGASIEADEAWQTGEGVWYRKGGVVALLNPKQVKAIKKVTLTPPATPAPSPAQSPTPLSAAAESKSRILTPPRRQR